VLRNLSRFDLVELSLDRSFRTHVDAEMKAFLIACFRRNGGLSDRMLMANEVDFHVAKRRKG